MSHILLGVILGIPAAYLMYCIMPVTNAIVCLLLVLIVLWEWKEVTKEKDRVA